MGCGRGNVHPSQQGRRISLEEIGHSEQAMPAGRHGEIPK